MLDKNMDHGQRRRQAIGMRVSEPGKVATQLWSAQILQDSYPRRR